MRNSQKEKKEKKRSKTSYRGSGGYYGEGDIEL